MKRLAADHALDQLIQHQRLKESDVNSLAARLVRFYGQLPPEPVPAENYLRAIQHHIRANTEELSKPEYQLDS